MNLLLSGYVRVFYSRLWLLELYRYFIEYDLWTKIESHIFISMSCSHFKKVHILNPACPVWSVWVKHSNWLRRWISFEKSLWKSRKLLWQTRKGQISIFEARLPNCIEGAVNISNWGFRSFFLNIVILFDRVKIRKIFQITA